MLESTIRDWPEDFPHENGNYLCKCCICGNFFAGYKRRVVCKVCDEKSKTDWAALSPAEQEAATKKNHEEVKKLLDEFDKKWQS